VARVVLALAQQPHAVHPGVVTAAVEQQQPPRHRLVPQSKPLAQASPGDSSAHAPVPSAHAAQPACSAVARQQAPPRQPPEKQLALAVQAAPGG